MSIQNEISTLQTSVAGLDKTITNLETVLQPILRKNTNETVCTKGEDKPLKSDISEKIDLVHCDVCLLTERLSVLIKHLDLSAIIEDVKKG